MDEGWKPAPMRVVWGVQGLLHAVSDALQARLGTVTVQGELSGFMRAASGHCYFNLKDDQGGQALVRCAMFRRAAGLLGFAPADGQTVELRARIAIYEPRGELQLVVESMRMAGAGALYEQFLRLKAKLESEGLFELDRKRPIPVFAKRVGVITSRAGAALHDVLTALQRRAPHVEVVLYPSPVQGAEAPPALVQALHTAQRRAEVDVLLLCRGGGSLEDLWAFNDERVVRAVAACSLPVICGVGHETDITLSDLAADLRAPTPTAAAELVATARQTWLDRLQALEQHLARRMTQRLESLDQRVDRMALRLSRPTALLSRSDARLRLLSQRLQQSLPLLLERRERVLQTLRQRQVQAGHTQLERQARRLDALQARLEALNPRHVLARGFAWLDDGQGRALSSVQQLQAGDAVRAVLADGQADLTVRRVRTP